MTSLRISRQATLEITPVCINISNIDSTYFFATDESSLFIADAVEKIDITYYDGYELASITEILESLQSVIQTKLTEIEESSNFINYIENTTEI
jgi:hypothetical protein